METSTRQDGRPHWLLSLHEDTNANATLFRDGRPVFAVAEGRLTGVKYAGGFPTHAVRAALRHAGIGLDDVDTVVSANRTHFLPRVLPNLLPEEEHDYYGLTHKAWLLFQHLVARSEPAAFVLEQTSKAALRRRLPRLAPLVDHHTAHAVSAWLTSGYADAVAVTADNMGDGYSSKVFACRGGRCHFQYGSSARHSPGQFYGEIAQLLGFHNLNAGKVTGLAARGDWRPGYGIVSEMLQLDERETGFATPGLLWRSRRRGHHAALRKLGFADIAAAAQRRLEDVMVAYVRRAVRELGMSDVVLAGGTFANVAVNRRILALPEVRRVYVHPAMNDQGISMGAGFAHLLEHAPDLTANAPLESVFLGPEYGEEEMGRALEASKLRYERPTDVAESAADALAQGKVVARYAGRLEYGPRALGNRSILYRADDASVNHWLNARLHRTEFMPFAPVTLERHAADQYLDLQGAEDAARYMTIAVRVRDEAKRRIPGVVHLDGTARPQILRPGDNPGYERILERYVEKTGHLSVINTSFNMHGKPIVCTPSDAVTAFRESGLDRMVMGPFFVTNTEDSKGP